MRNLYFLILVLMLPVSSSLVITPMEIPTQNPDNLSEEPDIVERNVTARGTLYHISVDLNDHVLSVEAEHYANNTTSAGFSVDLDGMPVVNKAWHPSKGDEMSVTVDLMPHYLSDLKQHEISFGTYGAFTNLSYNFTVPREHNGQFLRPTITDVNFERLNQSWVRMTVTLQSDTKYHYPSYVRVWTPNLDAKQVELFLDKGENVTRNSIVLPVDEGEVVEGEIRLHPRHLNGSSPLHTQYEFYGRPGSASFREVPYEPLSDRQVMDTYEYENDSVSSEDSTLLSEGQYKIGLAGLAVGLLVVIVLAVLVSRRRQLP